ncbi:PDZ domain-containing protein [Candidatus Nitrososphaera sp. FF02]|uniref:PDZ domain-containing protein n=1 Tax=Candidatus Nitrososphaera sp. FF02 TaxID=3398226 RepID=UPI0039ECA254
MHTLASTGGAFAILFAVLGFSFVYVSANPITLIIGDPWAGFLGTPLTPAIAEAAGTNEQSGFLVALVYSGGPADRAGVRDGDRVVDVEGEPICIGGDIIIEVDGRPVTSEQDIRAAIDSKNVGDTLIFTVVRGSVVSDIPVLLEQEPEQTPALPQC